MCYGNWLNAFQVPSRYVKLANHLTAGEWEKADEETTQLLMEREQSSLFSAVWKNMPREFTLNEIFAIPAQRIFEYCQSIPCEDILVVDYLWVHFSNGRFGLSVQNKMAQESSLKSIDNIVTRRSWIEGIDNLKILADRCGWREDNYWIYYEDLTFDIKAPMGHLPANHLFLLDQASGLKNHVFGKRETDVMYAPIVWHALASRLTCVGAINS